MLNKIIIDIKGKSNDSKIVVISYVYSSSGQHTVKLKTFMRAVDLKTNKPENLTGI